MKLETSTEGGQPAGRFGMQRKAQSAYDLEDCIETGPPFSRERL